MPVRDNAALLAEKTRQRRRRGVVLLVTLIVLAVIAGGTGWYFGWGPGSQVRLPDTLAGTTPAEATEILTELGLKVDPANGTTYSPDVPVDLVADTAPEPLGGFVAHGATVQLLISLGPEPLALPTLVGLPEEQAKAAVEDARFTLGESRHQFDAEVPLGTVLDALAADGSSLVGAATYGEQQPITLVVSAGPLPDVTGRTVDEAIALIESAGLSDGAIREDEYSDTVPQGAVIRVASADGVSPIRVGDTVDLITSKGPEPVLIPDVVGQTWADAKQQLLDAGFELDYNIFADAAPGLFTVSDLTPDGGTTAPKGSVVKVNFSS